jgi:hypothetical protein
VTPSDGSHNTIDKVKLIAKRAHAWRAYRLGRVSGVQIPPSPPNRQRFTAFSGEPREIRTCAPLRSRQGTGERPFGRVIAAWMRGWGFCIGLGMTFMGLSMLKYRPCCTKSSPVQH